MIDCAESIQMERAMQRDGNTAQLIQNIMNSQASRQQRASYADDIIENDEMRKRFGENGWAFVKDKFHYERLVNDITTLYDSLLP